MDYKVKKLKKEDINIKNWQFEFQQRGEQPISLCDFFCRSLSRYLLPWINGGIERCDYLFTDSSKGYNNPKQQQLVFQGLRKKLEDSVALKHFLKSAIEFPRDFNQEADEVNEVINDRALD